MKTLDLKEKFLLDLIICKEEFGTHGIDELNRIIDILRKGHKLSPKYKDHSLNSYKEFKNRGYRDCHIVTVDNNWVLIYLPKDKVLTLVRTGTHERIFKYSN